MRTLEGQTAVVTGGARGIGKGIASVLAAEGAGVAIADVDGAEAERVSASLRQAGFRALAVETDVTQSSSTEAMAQRVNAELGPIQILAANAGVYRMVRIMNMNDAEWDSLMDINLKGALHAIQCCLPGMLDGGYGRIVLTSSITGPVTGYAGFAHYGASKAAMLGMMRSIALELIGEGITINAVMPGNVATEGLDDMGEEHKANMLAAMPMGRFATTEDIGWAVRFLAAPEAAYITGQTLIVDGGQVLPESPEASA